MVVTVERVIYVADGGHMESRIMDAGLPTFSQIAGSDCAYIRTKSRHSRSERKEFLHSCNPGIKVYTSHDWKHFRREFLAADHDYFCIILHGVLSADVRNGNKSGPVGRYFPGSVFTGSAFSCYRSFIVIPNPDICTC